MMHNNKYPFLFLNNQTTNKIGFRWMKGLFVDYFSFH